MKIVAPNHLNLRELKNFQKIFLKAGESKVVQFHITEQDLMFYDSELNYRSEAGDFKAFVGPNSRDVQEVVFIFEK